MKKILVLLSLLLLICPGAIAWDFPNKDQVVSRVGQATKDAHAKWLEEIHSQIVSDLNFKAYYDSAEHEFLTEDECRDLYNSFVDDLSKQGWYISVCRNHYLGTWSVMVN